MIDQLRTLAGRAAVRTGEEAARWAVHGTVPRAVVAPTSVEAAAAVLARASEEGWAVEPAGAGGRLGDGRPPARLDVVLTAERLSAFGDYGPADLTATVGAGVRLGALADRLAQHGQWLPLDPPGGTATTLGAVVSTAAAGPLRLGHGTPRDHVLGLQLVTGDGRILALGGGVVKNVAGYDLTKLVIGSRGTLGLVTRVNVRLRARPARDLTIALTAPESAVLLEIAESARDLRLEAAALEIASPPVVRRLLGRDDDAWALLARFQGTAEATEDAEHQFTGLARSAGDGRSEGAVAGRALWAELAAWEAAAPLVVRFADRRAALRETLGLARVALAAGQQARGAGRSRPSAVWAAAAAGGPTHAAGGPPADGPGNSDRDTRRPQGPPALLVHAGAGIVRGLIDADSFAAAPAEAWADALATARAALATRRGTVTLVRAPAALTGRFEPYGDAGPALGLMQALKAQFDPAGVLAPGRFVV